MDEAFGAGVLGRARHAAGAVDMHSSERVPAVLDIQADGVHYGTGPGNRVRHRRVITDIGTNRLQEGSSPPNNAWARSGCLDATRTLNP